MNTYNLFRKSLKKDWYMQGANAVPLFACTTSWSGFTMKKILGYRYNSFLFNICKDYMEFHYLNSDLKRIWNIIKRKLIKNPYYLRQLKRKYESIFKKHEKLFDKISYLKLDSLSDKELLALFKKCASVQTDSMGIAHIIESLGLGIEQEFKKQLFNEIEEGENFNRYCAILTAPTKLSFIAQEEKELQRIKKIPLKERKKALERHLKKYFWIRNSCAAPKEMTIQLLEKRLKVLREAKKGPKKSQLVSQDKNRLIKKLKLSKKTKKMIEFVNFTTVWHDERKRNILKSVGYFGKVIKEISRRIKIPTRTIYYMGLADIERLNLIKDIGYLKGDLGSRIKGIFFLMEENQEFKVTGELYKKLIRIQKRLIKKSIQKENEIKGTIANGGTAIGKVAICKGLSSLRKVKKGNILVSSMTRPEFMPTLKKAVAIITDEGGITCHAAIVSRELNIPCIIGTRIATKILKDGDLVEVDAEKGTVKIIK